MISIAATDDWRSSHPGAVIGLLELSGIVNASSSSALDERKRATEARLRDRYQGFTRPDFMALPVMAAYDRYYNRFDKTYHVLLQVESIVLKGKSLPSVSPLVDANFIAEVETLVLTAGHDVERLREPIVMDVAQSGEQMTQLNGATKTFRAGDMIMRDAGGISCSIIYGQDNRSPIYPATSHVLYVAYVPPGVPAAAVEAQFDSIEANVRLFAPNAAVAQRRVIAA
jgi:DNA/RNA-binding domain of Phe-tRNA-synthetase-like protein